MNKAKIVLTGGTGLLGSNWLTTKSTDYDFHVHLNRKKVQSPNFKTFHADLNNFDETFKIIEKIKPDLIIHPAGITSVEECEKNKESAYQLNVTVSTNLAEMAKRLNIPFVFISTDHLFSDLNLFKTEEAPVHPVNYYAYTKIEAEKQILKSNPKALIARTTFYGHGHQFRDSFTDWILKNLKANKEIKMFTDVFFTPLYAQDLIDLVHHLVDKKQSGIFNVCGPERISKYEFGLKVAKTYGLNANLIHPTQVADVLTVNRPREMSLDISKMKKVLPDYYFKNIEESLQRLKTDDENHLPEKINQLFKQEGTPMLPYGKHYIDESDIQAVVELLKTGWLTQGPKVTEFENEVARIVGAKYGVAISTWTSGLHLACLAADVKPGDVVITSPISFAASSNCALYVGAKPDFADVELETVNMDPVELEKVCKKHGKVKAIIPVHFGGLTCDMEKISAIAKKYGAVIIEDAAHAIGGKHRDGSYIGSCKNSLMTGFSFHPVKNIATGEGSVITTNDQEIYKRLLRLRSHGINKGNDSMINEKEAFTNGKKNQWYYEMQELGYNFRITDLQCALGLSQLKKLFKFLDRRVQIAERYDQEFKHLTNLTLVQAGQRKISGNHLYIVRVNFEKLKTTRNEIFEKFAEVGIMLNVHYIPIPMQPYYANELGFKVENYPKALEFYRECITLPLFPSMTDKDVDLVINTVKAYFK